MNYFNYYTEIEDAFVRRRGRHLILSPLDWALMATWKEMGVPLHVVLRGIEKSFDSYESRPRKRSVKSLFYCQEEVEAQYAEWLEMQQGASAAAAASADAGAGNTASADADERLPFPRAAIAAHLSEGRAALASAAEERRARTGDDELCETLERSAARLSELEADFLRAARPDAEHLEASLTDLERLLDRALRAHTQASTLDALRSQAEEQLRPYRTRMDAAVYAQTRENIETKALREHHRLPRLSLFYL